MRQPKEKGRPSGKPYPHVRSLRFGDQDIERLAKLSAALELPEAQVVRMAIRELAKREKVE